MCSLMSEAMRSVAWTTWREASPEKRGTSARASAIGSSPRLRERVHVADDADALGDRELVGRGHQPAQQVALVERAVVAELAVVGEHPCRARADGRRHRALRLGQQAAGAALLAAPAGARADRHPPGLGRRAARAEGQQAFLREGQARRAAGAVERHRDDRNARLVEERRERGGDTRPRRGLDRLQEVALGRVAEAVRLQVGVHAGPELLRPGPRLEHRQDRGALLVRDPVEGVDDVVVGRDLLADLARRDERVVEHDVRARQTTRSTSSAHSGFHSIIVRSAIHVAKDSFSHTSSHHASVTRSPNHWCAISCALMEACDALEADRLFLRSGASRTRSDHVIRPAFSMAENVTVCGIASWSSFAYGYGMPKYASRRSSSGPVVCAA